MNNFFLRTKETILAPNPTLKSELLTQLKLDFDYDKLTFNNTQDTIVFDKPSFSSFCNIVPAHEIPRKKNFHEDDGKISLLHAIAHIEYSAIDLALDACYRFINMPKQYYKDWIEVAVDENRHFNMLTKLLDKYNVKYGDIDVHQGLFDASMKTLELIPRMALIPRYMEANGLDANLMIINKLKKIKNTNEIVEVLETILEEEIIHVKKGDIWYKFACNENKNLKCNYFDIVNKIYPNSFKSNKHLNIDARRLAGFSDEEIDFLYNIN